MQVDIVTPTTYARSITSQLMQQRADIGDPTIRGETTVKFKFVHNHYLY